MPLPPPIEARGLRKRYGDTFALDGFDLDVSAGSVHALLGPNGAGKSTAVHTLATLTRIDEGEARVAGFDVRTQHAQVRSVIGLVGQSAALDEILHGRENLVMFARLHGLDSAAAQARAAELLEAMDVADAADRKVSTYSGGMRRRLDIAAAPHHPTGGALPRRADDRARPARAGRRLGRRTPRGRAGHDGAAHHAVPRGGRPARRPDHGDGRRSGRGRGHPVRAEGQARRGPGARRPADGADADAARAAVAAAVDSEVHVDEERSELVVEAGTAGGTTALLAVVRALDAAAITPTHVQLREPTLDEVFLHLTDRPTTRDGGHR